METDIRYMPSQILCLRTFPVLNCFLLFFIIFNNFSSFYVFNIISTSCLGVFFALPWYSWSSLCVFLFFLVLFLLPGDMFCVFFFYSGLVILCISFDFLWCFCVFLCVLFWSKTYCICIYMCIYYVLFLYGVCSACVCFSFSFCFVLASCKSYAFHYVWFYIVLILYCIWCVSILIDFWLCLVVCSTRGVLCCSGDFWSWCQLAFCVFVFVFLVLLVCVFFIYQKIQVFCSWILFVFSWYPSFFAPLFPLSSYRAFAGLLSLFWIASIVFYKFWAFQWFFLCGCLP